MRRHQCQRVRRNGSIYLAALGVATVIATLSVGGIVASRVQLRSANDGNDVADARCAAASGLEFVRELTMLNSTWRTSGVCSGSISIAGCNVVMTVTDTADGNLSNLPLDPILITSMARKGTGVCQSLSQTAIAVGTPYTSLAYGLHTAGQLHVLSGKRLISNQPVSAGTEYKGDGILEGSVLANKLTVSGLVYGSSTLATTTRAVPTAATTAAAYQALGTAISPGNSMSKITLGPGRNPYGAVNANGVYVITTNNPLTIQNCRIVGTLIIISTKAVIIQNNVSIAPARSDFPSLIITGDATFSYDSTTNLSEPSMLTNFNPSGVPYNGSTDTDTLDTYPSEIDGLVEVGGQLTLSGTGTVRGAILDESTGSDAVKISNTFQVIYDPKLFRAPPNFYTTSVQMTAQPGTTTPVVN